MDNTLAIIIKSKALELGIDPEVAKAIMDNWFKYTRELMKSADPDDPESYKNIRWIKFGIIYSTESKRKRTKQNFNKENRC